ncbi:MAG: hypothetical protein ACHQU1_10430 [Gemmatimonadales bacterium]
MKRTVTALFTLGCLATARPLAAQAWRALELSAGATAARFRSTAPGNAGASSGVVAGGDGRILIGPVSLHGWYLEGRLAPDTGTTTRDLVDAGLLLAVRPTPWAVLAAGPHLRAYVLPAGTERWVLWEGRARVEESIIAGTVRAHVELRAAISGTVNGQKADAARGGEAGITARFPRSLLWARLTYTIDHAQLVPSGTETLEGVTLTVGLGGR